MKFSESWLRQSVNPSISTEDLVAQITMAGLEVDAVESASPDISGVVVGEIISVEQHPDADKLRSLSGGWKRRSGSGGLRCSQCSGGYKSAIRHCWCQSA